MYSKVNIMNYYVTAIPYYLTMMYFSCLILVSDYNECFYHQSCGCSQEEDVGHQGGGGEGEGADPGHDQEYGGSTS